MSVAAAPAAHRQQLAALQGLRAAAALLVVIDHAMATLAEKVGLAINLPLAYHLGGLGVAAFFVISGFVMVLSHGQDFGQQRSGDFAWRRLGRVLPLYYLTTAIYALKLAAEGKAPSAEALLQSALFIPHQGAAGEFGHPVYGLGWTLQYEMTFYAVFALALALPLRRGVALLCGVFLCGVAAGAAVWLEAWPRLAYLARPIVLYFLLGVAFGLWRLRRGAFASGLGFTGASSVATVAMGVAAAAFVVLPQGDMIAPLCIALACAACMGAHEKPQHGPSGPVRLVRTLGDATYSIYLTHSFLLGPLGRVAARWAPGIRPLAFIAISLGLAVLVGVLVHRHVEKPLLALWNRRTPARPARPSASAARAAPHRG